MEKIRSGVTPIYKSSSYFIHSEGAAQPKKIIGHKHRYRNSKKGLPNKPRKDITGMWNTFDSLGLPEEYQNVINNISREITGSEFVKTGYSWYYDNYDTSAPSQRNKSGKVFEWLILQALCQARICPAYYQATVLHVPHVVYDILLYHETHPVILSCKVSLRERWKQADLEALALRQVYRGLKVFSLL